MVYISSVTAVLNVLLAFAQANSYITTSFVQWTIIATSDFKHVSKESYAASQFLGHGKMKPQK